MRNAVVALTGGRPTIVMPQLSPLPRSGSFCAAATDLTPGSACSDGSIARIARRRSSSVSRTGMVASIDCDAVRSHAGIDAAQVGDAADEQPRAGGEQDGERHLRDDEPAFEPAAAAPHPAGPRRRHRRLQAAAAPERDARNDGDEQRRNERGQHRGPEHRPVEPGVLRQRAERQRADEHLESDDGERAPIEAGGDADQQRFDDELLDQPLAVGAERGADGHLGARARRPARASARRRSRTRSAG